MIELLSREFIAAADDKSSRRRHAEEGKLFDAMMDQLPTRQGVHVFTPSGKLLGTAVQKDSVQTTPVHQLIKEALEKWKALTKEERLLPQDLPESPGGSLCSGIYPEGGLVLRVTTRDLPGEASPLDKEDDNWLTNFGRAWFTQEEVASMIPPSRDPGTRHAWPDKLARRIARFHLVDVKEMKAAYGREDIGRAELVFVVNRVEGNLLKLNIEGVAQARSASGQVGLRHRSKGYGAKLLGRASYAIEEKKFVSFELVARGTRSSGPSFGAALDLTPSAPWAGRLPPGYVIQGGKDYFD